MWLLLQQKECHKYKGDWILGINKCRGLCNIMRKEGTRKRKRRKRKQERIQKKKRKRGAGQEDSRRKISHQKK